MCAFSRGSKVVMHDMHDSSACISVLVVTPGICSSRASNRPGPIAVGPSSDEGESVNLLECSRQMPADILIDYTSVRSVASVQPTLERWTRVVRSNSASVCSSNALLQLVACERLAGRTLTAVGLFAPSTRGCNWSLTAWAAAPQYSMRTPGRCSGGHALVPHRQAVTSEEHVRGTAGFHVEPFAVRY